MSRTLFQYHPVIGYQFIPGLKARVDHEAGGYLLRTNQSGFRCRHEFQQEKKPGTKRILLFGDSYTAGDGVSDKYRYCEIMETLLPNTEVFNFGLPGSGTDQQYLIWREFAREVEHDLVIIAVLVENIRRIVAKYRPYQTQDGRDLVLAKPYFTLDQSEKLKLHHVPVPRHPLDVNEFNADEAASVDRGGKLLWLRNLVNRFGPRAKEMVQRITRYQPFSAYDKADNPDWQLMEAILRNWTAQLDKPVVICPIPFYQYIEKTASFRNYQRRFASIHSPPKVLVHDPLAEFHAHPADIRRGFRFETDCHMTPAGHGVLGHSLAEYVRPLLGADGGASV